MSSKFLSGLVLGAAAGVAIALFITSDKGKELLEDITDAAGSAADKAKEKFSDLGDELAGLVKKGKGIVEDLEQKAKAVVS